MTLFADGFEKALIGVGTQCNEDVAVYDYQKCIEILNKAMPLEDAVEFMEFNVLGSYLGKYTPVFINQE